MTAVSDNFYVTLFSKSSHQIYEDNTLSAFKIKLAQPKDLNSVENCEVGICDVSCPPPILGTGMPLITVGNTHVLVYCNVISAQFVGNDIVRCLSTFICPSTNCDNIFDKIYYVPVEQRKFQKIRSSFLKQTASEFLLKTTRSVQKLLIIFARIKIGNCYKT
jgi:hypothetical protein